MSRDLREIALRFVRAVEAGAPAEELTAFYDPDVVALEHPNRLLPNGVRRNLPDILEASRRGQSVMVRQTFDVQSVTVEGERVVIEAAWTGILAIPLGSLPEGGAMRAHFAIFIEFRDGRIVATRNYDCFEPF